jgi:hypothetical protein
MMEYEGIAKLALFGFGKKPKVNETDSEDTVNESLKTKGLHADGWESRIISAKPDKHGYISGLMRNKKTGRYGVFVHHPEHPEKFQHEQKQLFQDLCAHSIMANGGFGTGLFHLGGKPTEKKASGADNMTVRRKGLFGPMVSTYELWERDPSTIVGMEEHAKHLPGAEAGFAGDGNGIISERTNSKKFHQIKKLIHDDDWNALSKEPTGGAVLVHSMTHGRGVNGEAAKKLHYKAIDAMHAESEKAWKIKYSKTASIAELALGKLAFEFKPDSAAQRSAALAFKKFRQGQDATHATREDVLGGLQKRLTPSHGILKNVMKSAPKGIAKGVGKGLGTIGKGGLKVIESGATYIPPTAPRLAKNFLERLRHAGNKAPTLKSFKELMLDVPMATIKEIPEHLADEKNTSWLAQVKQHWGLG